MVGVEMHHVAFLNKTCSPPHPHKNVHAFEYGLTAASVLKPKWYILKNKLLFSPKTACLTSINLYVFCTIFVFSKGNLNEDGPVDLVLNCVHNFEARMAINTVCILSLYYIPYVMIV